MNDENLLSSLSLGDCLTISFTSRNYIPEVSGTLQRLDIAGRTLQLSVPRITGGTYIRTINQNYTPPEKVYDLRTFSFREIAIWSRDGGMPLDPTLTAETDQLALLKRSIEQWNIWRTYYPDIEPDFHEMDLSGITLKGANLSATNLIGANLSDIMGEEMIGSGADLKGANLSRANLIRADLTNATMSEANLTEAMLSEADLSGADLSGADLTRADLSAGNLSFANLRDANLRDASLDMADFTGTTTTGCIGCP